MAEIDQNFAPGALVFRRDVSAPMFRRASTLHKRRRVSTKG